MLGVQFLATYTFTYNDLGQVVHTRTLTRECLLTAVGSARNHVRCPNTEFGANYCVRRLVCCAN